MAQERRCFGEYDIAVIGAGHAGCEAALAAAKLGLRTVVFAVTLDGIATLVRLLQLANVRVSIAATPDGIATLERLLQL